MIQILLATFNGEKHLAEQIESILAQTYDDWELIIHDDGSDDSTVEIIREYCNRYPDKITFIDDGMSTGSAKGNFSYLLKYSTADYVMFCDQDDVWLEDKIENTLSKMNKIESESVDNTPVLVHTNLKVVDNDLNVLDESFWHYQNLNPACDSLNRLLVQNIITGCTVMINRPLVEHVIDIPPEAVMHDWWLGLVAATFGKIGYLNEPSMLYRQHEGNDTGAKRWSQGYVLRNGIELFFKNKGIALKNRRQTTWQAGAFLRVYAGSIPKEQLNLINIYANSIFEILLVRKYYFFRYRFFKNGIIRNIAFFLRF